MTYILAIFSSRNETLYFANLFRSSGYNVNIINTPKEAGHTCGISVRFDERLLPNARQFLRSKPFRAFVGLYRISYMGQRIKLERI